MCKIEGGGDILSKHSTLQHLVYASGIIQHYYGQIRPSTLTMCEIVSIILDQYLMPKKQIAVTLRELSRDSSIHESKIYLVNESL